MSISFIILNILWISSAAGVVYNSIKMGKEMKDDHFDFHRLRLYELRSDVCLILMWLSVIGIILYNRYIILKTIDN